MACLPSIKTKAPLSQHYTDAGYLAALHHGHTHIKTSSTMSDEGAFAEVDPTGRFGRYHDILGSGSMKKVYKAFDLKQGMEVAWNQIKLRCFSDDRRAIDRLYAEVGLLRELQHDNIIRLFDVWKDEECDTINIITELCNSGSLRQYRKKHRHVSLRAIKKWSWQILRSLDLICFFFGCCKVNLFIIATMVNLPSIKTKAPLSQHYTDAGYLAALHHSHTHIKTSSTMSNEEAFAEVDPTGRFGRDHDILRSGSMKKVYRVFDHEQAMEPSC